MPFFNPHKHSANRTRATTPPAIEYRQLVSRAMTQRLHSPTLSPASIDQWELDERRVAKVKARQRLWRLGVPWDRFVMDVKEAEREVHVLSPTRYRAPEVGNGGARRD